MINLNNSHVLNNNSIESYKNKVVSTGVFPIEIFINILSELDCYCVKNVVSVSKMWNIEIIKLIKNSQALSIHNLTFHLFNINSPNFSHEHIHSLSENASIQVKQAQNFKEIICLFMDFVKNLYGMGNETANEILDGIISLNSKKLINHGHFFECIPLIKMISSKDLREFHFSFLAGNAFDRGNDESIRQIITKFPNNDHTDQVIEFISSMYFKNNNFKMGLDFLLLKSKKVVNLEPIISFYTKSLPTKDQTDQLINFAYNQPSPIKLLARISKKLAEGGHSDLALKFAFEITDQKSREICFRDNSIILNKINKYREARSFANMTPSSLYNTIKLTNTYQVSLLTYNLTIEGFIKKAREIAGYIPSAALKNTTLYKIEQLSNYRREDFAISNGVIDYDLAYINHKI